MTEVQLGGRYEDTVTGFVGVATIVHHYLGGAMRVTLEAPTVEEDERTYVIERLRPAAEPPRAGFSP